jgi:serine/threonine protein kinase
LVDGQVLARYVIEELIGGGGMADVFRARAPHLDRTVAIKRLCLVLSDAEEIRARFQREAQAVAGLRHPNVVGYIVLGFAHLSSSIGFPCLEARLKHA